MTGAGNAHDDLAERHRRAVDGRADDRLQVPRRRRHFTIVIYGSGVNLVAVGTGTVQLAGMPDTPKGDGRYSLERRPTSCRCRATPTKKLLYRRRTAIGAGDGCEAADRARGRGRGVDRLVRRGLPEERRLRRPHDRERQEALRLVESEKPALVVLDLMLPDLDGVEVCKRIRQKGDLPVLMLTARDEDVDKIIGLEVGADDYMTKPFNPRELVARVKAILRRSGAGARQARERDAHARRPARSTPAAAR